MVPVVFAFRADYASPVRAELFAAIRELHTKPVGQQILTIFHSEKVEEQSASSLDSALELLAEHARLTRRETAASATVSGAPDDPPPGRTP